MPCTLSGTSVHGLLPIGAPRLSKSGKHHQAADSAVKALHEAQKHCQAYCIFLSDIFQKGEHVGIPGDVPLTQKPRWFYRNQYVVVFIEYFHR